jgi:Zn-dependent membrane protease YugP
MKLRAGLFPIVNFAGQLWFPLFFLAIIMGIGTATGQLFIQLAVLAFAGVLAFHVVTLPVEINASTRAYGILTRYGILSRGEADGTKRVLGAAAFTYIAAALTSLLTLLYLLVLSRE